MSNMGHTYGVKAQFAQITETVNKDRQREVHVQGLKYLVGYTTSDMQLNFLDRMFLMPT
jgi:hypothetical protein